MKFKINNTEWTIELVDEATINNEMKNDGTLGVTIYKSQTIMLLKDQANIIKTLKHELTHVWLYEYGHNQNDDKTFSYEDVCEIVASSNDFVNEIVNQYLGIKPHTHHGYEHNENDSKKGASKLSTEERKMVDRVTKIWYNYKSKK